MSAVTNPRVVVHALSQTLLVIGAELVATSVKYTITLDENRSSRHILRDTNGNVHYQSIDTTTPPGEQCLKLQQRPMQSIEAEAMLAVSWQTAKQPFNPGHDL